MSTFFSAILLAFVVISILTGTIWAIVLQGVVALIAWYTITVYSYNKRRSTSLEAAKKLKRDVELLKKCKTINHDKDICSQVGPQDRRIRENIENLKYMIDVLNDKRNANTAGVKDMFGGRTPSSGEMGALKGRLKSRLYALEAWYHDPQARNIYSHTGKVMDQKEIIKEIRRREGRIYELSARLKEGQKFDEVSAAILAGALFIVPNIGIAGVILYATIRILGSMKTEETEGVGYENITYC